MRRDDGYHRKHAIARLRGKRHHRNRKTPIRRRRRRRYLAADQRAVPWLAEFFDQIGSKRLRAARDVELDNLRGDLDVSRAGFKRLKHISSSTMDRLRRTERRSAARHRGGTKPGTRLKSQIKVRTFADGDDKRPGFEEIDLLQHDGGNPSGFFACTLNVTDVCTGWTEMGVVPTKAQKHVFAALEHIRCDLPGRLVGMDSDHGAEFTNDELVRYCTLAQRTFPRGRLGRENDHPDGEPKNWSVIRRVDGSGRDDTPKQVNQRNALDAVDRLDVNHFLPVQKLVVKVRDGKVKKVDDDLTTPYHRVLDSPEVRPPAKRKLRTLHAKLDAVELKCQIDEMRR